MFYELCSVTFPIQNKLGTVNHFSHFCTIVDEINSHPLVTEQKTV